MTTQRVRVTFEFDIDDNERAADTRIALASVERSVRENVAVTPDVRLVRFTWMIPRVKR